MHKCVLTSTGHDFVTCDEPVVLFDPVAAQNHDAQALKRTTRSRDCEATYPLTRRYCLLMSYKPIVAAAEADDAAVETINTRTAWFSKNEVYVPPCGMHGQDALLRTFASKSAIFRSLAARYAVPSGTAA